MLVGFGVTKTVHVVAMCTNPCPPNLLTAQNTEDARLDHMAFKDTLESTPTSSKRRYDTEVQDRSAH